MKDNLQTISIRLSPKMIEFTERTGNRSHVIRNAIAVLMYLDDFINVFTLNIDDITVFLSTKGVK